MEFQKLIESRRSVRKYAEREVDREMLEEMISAASEAPSWKNQQTSRYHCVVSKDMLEDLRKSCLPGFNAKRSENAALIVTSFVKDTVGYIDSETPVNELGNGWGIYDLGLQTQNLILKAKDMGLDTLIMGIRDADKIRELLDIPEDEIIVSVIAVGYADEEPVKPSRKKVSETAKFY